jgi:predicted dehydrogenase
MFKLGMIGLDTSHSVVFPKLTQGKEEKVVDKLQVVSCMRFPTPFQTEEGQDQRQKTLEEMGIPVTRSFEEAVRGVDGILLEINDPSFHLEYFEKAAALGLPVFIDKPLADNLENGAKIFRLARKKNVKVWSSSSLRFTPEIVACAAKVKAPTLVHVYGYLGKASSGSSLVWYGVHTFEMLMTLMGGGAKSVFAREDACGVVSIIEYDGGRRGIVECNSIGRKYGGAAQCGEEAANFLNAGSPYPSLIKALQAFFVDGVIPVPLEETLEIQAMMEAAVKSLESGRTEPVYKP